MTSVRQTIVTQHHSSVQESGRPEGEWDNRLDALLEDLQTSVSRPGSAAGGAVNGPTSTPGTTRTYREVRTVMGQQEPANREYQIQYLTPANPTTVVAERAPSPGIDLGGGTNQLDLRQQRTVTSYKTVAYNYSSRDGSAGSGLTPGDGETSSPSVAGTKSPIEDAKLRQNLSELDNLLDNLHHAQKAGFGTEQATVTDGTVPASRGIDPGLLEDSAPLDHSTPYGGNRHVSRTVRTYQYNTQYGRDRSLSPVDSAPRSAQPLEALTPPEPRSPSKPLTSDSYSPSPQQPGSRVTTVRTYTYNTPGQPASSPKTYHTTPQPYPDVTSASYPYIDLTPPRSHSSSPYPPPQPSSKVTTTVRTYTYGSPGHPGNTTPPRQPSSYHATPEPPELPPTPQHPPSDVVHRSHSPSPYSQPPPPTRVITYKYSTHSSHSGTPPHPQEDRSPRPFPVPPAKPTGESGEPPKRLDDLMASFSDQEAEPEPVTPVRYTVETSRSPARPPRVPQEPRSGENGVALPPKSTPSTDRPKTKNVAGPPVYYPPGVELFNKKDEPVNAKMKDPSSGGPGKGDGKGGPGGAAVVPVCLPVCCAMPCVIL